MEIQNQTDTSSITLLLTGLIEGYETISTNVVRQPLQYYVHDEYFPYCENVTDLCMAIPLGEYWSKDRTYCLYLSTDTFRFYNRPARNWPLNSPKHARRHKTKDMSPAMLEWVFAQLESVLVKRGLD